MVGAWEGTSRWLKPTGKVQSSVYDVRHQTMYSVVCSSVFSEHVIGYMTVYDP